MLQSKPKIIPSSPGIVRMTEAKMPHPLKCHIFALERYKEVKSGNIFRVSSQTLIEKLTKLLRISKNVTFGCLTLYGVSILIVHIVYEIFFFDKIRIKLLFEISEV